MPKGPLIPDPQKRNIAIAVLMGLLFAVSMGLALLITGAGVGF